MCIVLIYFGYRRDFLEKKIANEQKLALTKNKNGDKKGALMHLKRYVWLLYGGFSILIWFRKKLFENEIDKINGGVTNLEQQAMAIESTSVTVDIVNAMKTGKSTLESMTKAIDVDEIEDLKADIQDQIQQSEEIDQIVSQSVGLDDTDDLEAELAELEAEGVEEELNTLPSVPTAKRNIAAENLPGVPTHSINDDDDALAALEAEMAS